ncbi:hypothetical protein Aoki45_29860 [Algoriphagus sp. oki45]|nr:hypothetical protein Aoki45_29860 [Algoriphagus sp. oki45]
MNGFEFVREECLKLGFPLESESLLVKKAHCLLMQGQPLTNLYWIKKGLFREFHDDGLEEFTNSFPSTGSFYLTGFYFWGKINSSFTLEALEDSTVEIFNLETLNHPKIEPKLIVEILKKISTIKYEQNLNWKLINGKKSFLHRWEFFKTKYPGIWYRIPQKHLASYFNVTPQYLSKLKSNRLL